MAEIICENIQKSYGTKEVVPGFDLDAADHEFMVFQNYALYSHMTIRDNIAFGLRRIKTPDVFLFDQITGRSLLKDA